MCVCALGGKESRKRKEKPEEESGWEEKERRREREYWFQDSLLSCCVCVCAAAAWSPWIGHLQDRAVVQERPAALWGTTTSISIHPYLRSSLWSLSFPQTHSFSIQPYSDGLTMKKETEQTDPLLTTTTTTTRLPSLTFAILLLQSLLNPTTSSIFHPAFPFFSFERKGKWEWVVLQLSFASQMQKPIFLLYWSVYVL